MITQSTTNAHISLIFKVLTIHSVVVANRTISIAILNAPTRFLHKVFRPCAIPPQQSGGATGETKPGATRSRTAPLKSDNGGNAHRTTPEKTSVVPVFPIAAIGISIVVLVKTIVVLVFPVAAPDFRPVTASVPEVDAENRSSLCPYGKNCLSLSEKRQLINRNKATENYV